ITVDLVPTGNEDNKDAAPKYERRKIDDIIDFIRDKYGWSEEMRWNEANSDESAELVEDDKEDEAEDDKIKKKKKKMTTMKKNKMKTMVQMMRHRFLRRKQLVVPGD
nr:hypothetical protein [Tanacetum cinerariifolium]GEZ43632.1 hypothetical protein [Tanacetum cinerariifolium]